MGKHLFLIHGRNFKPEEPDLKKLWLDALQYGVSRDHSQAQLNKLKATKTTFVYYGDISNEFLWGKGESYDPAEDAISRKGTLQELKSLPKSAFTKAKYKSRTGPLRGAAELIADLIANPANLFGIADNLISLIAPDMRHYWEEESDYGSAVRWRLTEPLAAAFRNGDDVMLISHSLGTMISYDVLWKFSHYGEYLDIRQHKLSKFVTLGSPLGNETVKDRLKGSNIRGDRRYPHNIAVWKNFAAEDDYISQDQTIGDDFRLMRAAPAKTRISDKRIYNLALRNGKPNQHHGAGYLIHPQISKAVVDWLNN
jgi:hypothetical protein